VLEVLRVFMAKRVSLKLDEKTFQRLKQLQEQHGFLTLSETIRFILREFFKGEKQ
jgi:metal-responsive CopG/Arc/MetJ family transcriptional regulator